MKTTALVSLVSAAFIGLGQPMRAGHPGGSAHFGGGAPHFSGGPHFNGGTPRFSGEGMRFSPSGVRPSPMRPHTFGPNGGFTVQSPRAATTFSRRPGQFE